MMISYWDILPIDLKVYIYELRDNILEEEENVVLKRIKPEKLIQHLAYSTLDIKYIQVLFNKHDKYSIYMFNRYDAYDVKDILQDNQNSSQQLSNLNNEEKIEISLDYFENLKETILMNPFFNMDQNKTKFNDLLI